MADGPQAKRSKPGPPAMARVESSVLGYDVIALLACSPGLRRRHFAPHAHTVRGATHYIVGLGSNATHVRDPDGLSKALADGVRDGLVDGDVGLPLPE